MIQNESPFARLGRIPKAKTAVFLAPVSRYTRFVHSSIHGSGEYERGRPPACIPDCGPDCCLRCVRFIGCSSKKWLKSCRWISVLRAASLTDFCMILPSERHWGRRLACLTHHLGTGGISKALARSVLNPPHLQVHADT